MATGTGALGTRVRPPRCKLMENRLRARDAANSRREDRKAMLMADRRAADEERLMERKAKESSTMDM
jgi:hypothetical protein